MIKNDDHCVFLSGNRCTIYEDRPLICRFYPFTMFKDDNYMFDVDRSCEGIGEDKVVNKEYFIKLIQEAKNNFAQS